MEEPECDLICTTAVFDGEPKTDKDPSNFIAMMITVQGAVSPAKGISAGMGRSLVTFKISLDNMQPILF